MKQTSQTVLSALLLIAIPVTAYSGTAYFYNGPTSSSGDSCGITPQGNGVAISTELFEANNTGTSNPNDNTHCGQSVTITYEGQSYVGVIQDIFDTSNTYDLDLVKDFFDSIAPDADGSFAMTWEFS